eukprot:6174588-Pleurochrysis_carterae.AAC.4
MKPPPAAPMESAAQIIVACLTKPLPLSTLLPTGERAPTKVRVRHEKRPQPERLRYDLPRRKNPFRGGGLRDARVNSDGTNRSTRR